MEQAEVLIQIPFGDEEQRKNLRKAETYLRKAGISFDTGSCIGSGLRDWEFDWSLKGATVYFKKFSDGLLPSGKPISEKPQVQGDTIGST